MPQKGSKGSLNFELLKTVCVCAVVVIVVAGGIVVAVIILLRIPCQRVYLGVCVPVLPYFKLLVYLVS